MERESSTDKEDDMEDDKQALLNLERNIENIERSMSASQLEQANYPGKKTGVWGELIIIIVIRSVLVFWWEYEESGIAWCKVRYWQQEKVSHYK